MKERELCGGGLLSFAGKSEGFGLKEFTFTWPQLNQMVALTAICKKIKGDCFSY